MNINQLDDQFLNQEPEQFVIIMQGWINGKDIDPDAVDFIRMRMELLQSQISRQSNKV
ncbi:hypothetical protein [Vibrio ordalii]|uniref:hypothetical protein n=1 Tax=Vibrio ordalii TaxID=28174 RepID=UPI00031B9A00|nr:hypothetical protein [Vibrio ordalii]